MISLRETCKEYFARRIREGWRCISLEGYNAVLLSPEGIRREIDLRNDVETLRPSGAGDETALFPVGATFNWECVDEETPDESSTIVTSENIYQSDLYNLPASSGSGTINFIKIYFRIGTAHADYMVYAKPYQKSGATTTEGNEVTRTGTLTFATFSQQWNTNPDDSAAWEWSDIDDLQIGISLKTDHPSFGWARCTQVYVEVDYTPSVSAPTVTTQAVTDIAATTATGNGNITDTGGDNPHTRGICWNTAGSPTTADSKSEDNGAGSYGTGAFSKGMTSLTPGQLYYVRAYAINSVGTSYGGEVSFTALNPITVTPPTIALSLTTFIPTVLTPRLVTPPTLALVLTQYAPTVSVPRLVTPPTLALSLTGYAPSIVVGVRAVPTTLALILTTYIPTVDITEHVYVTPPTLALSLTTYAPTVTASDHKVVTPPTLALVLTGYAPSIIIGILVIPSTLALVLTEYVPTIAISDNQVVTPPTLALILTKYIPTVLTPRLVTPPTLAFVLTKYAPIIILGTLVIPPTLAFVLTKYAPTVTASDHKVVTPPTLALVLTGYAPSIVFRTGVSISIAFDTDPFAAVPTWTDITDDYLTIDTKRGRQHELDRFEAGVATILLNNADGNYWPDNAGGAYYPDIKIGKRMRINQHYGGITYPLYDGFVESWKPGWLSQRGGLGPVMVITCADLIRVMSRLPINDGVGYAEELEGTRIGNVLDDVNWPAGLRDIDAGLESVQATGALSNEIAQAHLLSVSQSALGLFYMTAEGDAKYEARSHRTASPHDTSQAVFGDDAGEMSYSAVDFALDDKLLYNEIRATRIDGAEQSEEDATSQTTYGHRGLVRTGLLLISDVIVQIYCAYLLARYKDNRTRVRSITIEPQSDPDNLWPKALGYEISTRITVRLNQASVDADYFIEGIEHHFDTRRGLWTTKWLLSDATGYLFTPSARDETIRPNAAGDENNNDATPGVGDNYEEIDEITSDDDTTYISNDIIPNAYKRDLYNIPSASYGQGTINSVTIYAKCRRKDDVNPAVAAKVKLSLKTGGIAFDGSAQNVTSDSYADFSEEWATNPDTAAAWTWADITALQVGISLLPPNYVSETPEIRCTQVWVVVNYTPQW